MNNVTAGIGGAVVVAIIAASAMVFANRSNTDATVAPTQVASTHTVCSDEKVVTRERNGTNSLAGTAIGAVAGGVIGHQFGGGRGKDVATAAGAVGGGYAGHEIAADNYPDQKVSYRQNCHEEPG